MTNKVIVQKTVGNISTRGEASSDRRDISMQDLLNIADAAAGGEVTSSEGVNVNVNVSSTDDCMVAREPDNIREAVAPSVANKPGVEMTREQKLVYLCRMVDWGYKPYYGTVEFGRLSAEQLDIEVDCAENWEEPANKPKGSHCGQITPSRVMEIEKRAEAERRNRVTERVVVFRNALMEAQHGYKLSPEGFYSALNSAVAIASHRFAEEANELEKKNDLVKELRSSLVEYQREVFERRDEMDKDNERMKVMCSDNAALEKGNELLRNQCSALNDYNNELRARLANIVKAAGTI